SGRRPWPGQRRRDARGLPVPPAPDPGAARAAAGAALGRRAGAVRTERPAVHPPRVAGPDGRGTLRPRCAVDPGVDGTLAERSRDSPALAARRARGAFAGVLVAGLSLLWPEPSSAAATSDAFSWMWRGALASFYGAVVEEVESRLLLVSLFVWLLARLTRRRTDTWAFVVAILLAALLFGIGHLPAAVAAGVARAPLQGTRIVVLNMLAGIVFGALYWKVSLEHAMVAHFCADLVLHVVLPALPGCPLCAGAKAHDRPPPASVDIRHNRNVAHHDPPTTAPPQTFELEPACAARPSSLGGGECQSTISDPACSDSSR